MMGAFCMRGRPAYVSKPGCRPGRQWRTGRQWSETGGADVGVQRPCWREEQPTVSAKDFLEGGGRGGRAATSSRTAASSPSRSTSRCSCRSPHGQVAQRRPVPAGRAWTTSAPSRCSSTPPGRCAASSSSTCTDGERTGRVAGQEEVQNALYRLLGNFVRAGRINKLILLHGPNGCAKSTLVDALKRGMEHYSREPQGALYRIDWIFPSEKLVKGSIGFGDARSGVAGELTTFAHLDEESIDVRMPCEMRDHPLFVMPRVERQEAARAGPQEKRPRTGDGEDVRPRRLRCSTASSVTSAAASTRALLAAYNGDCLRVLRHVQVRALLPLAPLPGGRGDGGAADERGRGLPPGLRGPDPGATSPPALQNLVLFEPHGPLVNANRGHHRVRGPAQAPAGGLQVPARLQRDRRGAAGALRAPARRGAGRLVATRSTWRRFKELPDFASFKGRIELVRVPYLRRYKVGAGDLRRADHHHARWASTSRRTPPRSPRMWAVLTRLKKPDPRALPGRRARAPRGAHPAGEAAPLRGRARPGPPQPRAGQELKKRLPALYQESDAYPNYEGRTGASRAGDQDRALQRRAEPRPYNASAPWRCSRS